MAEVVVGSEVQDIRQRDRKGTVIALGQRIGGREMVKVRWDDSSVQTIPLARLELFQAKRDVRSLLALPAFRGFGGIEDFIRNFTHRKLINPVDDTLYTLHASRTKLLPHQFKPLIRFLDSIHRRYLIADEVGLGKTIEAGIILSELRARRQLRSAMIFCPNHLRTKWEREMLDRFDERFRIIASRRDWNSLLDQMEEEGAADLRVIVGHKTLASRAVLERLTEGAPRFDLLVVDEAHHFKNTETIGRQLLGELSDSAGQLLLLTATPLQTHADNLLSLLRLLDEPAFQSRELFAQRLEVNAHLVHAERRLRTSDLNEESQRTAAAAAAQDLDRVPPYLRSRFGLELDDLVAELRDKASEAGAPLLISSLVDLSARLRERNLLAPYITRTRKVEVQQTCHRHVESVRPEQLTEKERAFYRLTVEWFREEVERRHGEQSVLFLSRTFERRLSSSLHGFARSLLNGTFSRGDSLLSDPPDHVLMAARELGREDSKFDLLCKMLDGLRREHPNEKIIIFASYRATLQYLSHRLSARGWDYEIIHGGVPMVPGDPQRDERGRRVDRFLHAPECRLLISSNVGGEGLDLQRASVVVNYDLPWNPATLEQRIGRVDRFGQKAEIIRVLNIVLPGTVEDVVFSRVYDRLRLFETAIGDFAEILGGIVKHLSFAFLRRDLTEEDLEEQARLAALRVEQTRRDLDEVLDRERELVAFDDDFADQLRTMDRHAQSIKPADLQRLVDGILRQRFPRSWIRPAGSNGLGEPSIFDFYVDPDLKARLKALLDGNRDSGVVWRFIRAVNEREAVRVTFDGETAEANSDLILLTSRHPVLQLLVRAESDPTDFHPVSAVQLPPQASLAVESGLLILLDAEFALGEQKRHYLMPVWIVDGQVRDFSIARQILRLALDAGSSVVPRQAPTPEDLVEWVDRAESAGDAELMRIMNRIVTQEENRIRPRVAELSERYTRRIAKSTSRVQELEYIHMDEQERAKKLKNARGYLRRLHRERRDEIERLSRLPEPSSELSVIGATWVEFDL